jgi:hypothetical protein
MIKRLILLAVFTKEVLSNCLDNQTLCKNNWNKHVVWVQVSPEEKLCDPNTELSFCSSLVATTWFGT